MKKPSSFVGGEEGGGSGGMGRSSVDGERGGCGAKEDGRLKLFFRERSALKMARASQKGIVSRFGASDPKKSKNNKIKRHCIFGEGNVVQLKTGPSFIHLVIK